jgi:hypothetical protein
MKTQPFFDAIQKTYGNRLYVIPFVLFFFACSNDTPPENSEETIRYERSPGMVDVIYTPCVDKQTVKELDNEPATVRRNNVFQTEESEISIKIEAASIDTFAFELQNNYEDVMPCPVISRYPVPEKYRIDGLNVTISGKITNCHVLLSSPNARYTPQNIFELTSIK